MPWTPSQTPSPSLAVLLSLPPGWIDYQLSEVDGKMTEDCGYDDAGDAPDDWWARCSRACEILDDPDWMCASKKKVDLLLGLLAACVDEADAEGTPGYLAWHDYREKRLLLESSGVDD
jgi:hypothetical protein